MNPQQIISEIIEHLRGMWRFRWLAVSVAWAISLAGWAYIYAMPDVYRATAKVNVDTDSLIGPVFQGLAISDNVASQVEAVSRALLTRPNLEAVARNTDLDLRATTPAQLERLITGLQDRIRVRANRERDVFDIAFEDQDRAKARDVVAAIVDAFVENSLRGQGDDADITERALESEIKDHEDRLISAETALAEFKKNNLGYMPDDRGDYYARLQAALSAVKEAEEEIRLLVETRNELQRQIQGEEPVFGLMGDGTGSGGSGCPQQSQISDLEAQLALLRVDYTDKHPRIQTLTETIAALQQQCDAALALAASSEQDTAPAINRALEVNPVYQNMRIQLSNTEVELASLRARLSAHRGEVDSLRRDVDKIADVETSLKRLNRDYGVVQSRYQELLSRRETLMSAKRLDPVTDTVQFRTLEPPFASARPVGPNRKVMLAGVMVLAVGASVVVTFLLNQLKPVFFTRNSLKKIVDLPVLGSVSLLLSPREVRKRRRRMVAFVATYVALFVATGAVVAFESTGSALLRQTMGGAIL